MGEARRRRKAGDRKGAEEQKKLDRQLEDTFPASDPPTETQPGGGGATGTEPPPAGQKTGR